MESSGINVHNDGKNTDLEKKVDVYPHLMFIHVPYGRR